MDAKVAFGPINGTGASGGQRKATKKEGGTEVDEGGDGFSGEHDCELMAEIRRIKGDTRLRSETGDVTGRQMGMG